MPDWGTTSTGHYRPRYPEIRAANASRYTALFGANRPTTDDSIDGHFISLISEIEADLREADEATYNSQYLDTAGGVSLDQVVALIHTRRLEVFSTVTLTLGGVASTVIDAGSLVELDDSKERFALDAEATIGGGGTVDAAATAVNAGAITATASSDWTIINTVTGWSTVTNAADETVLGQSQETDPELRTRTRAAVVDGGVLAALLDVDSVTAANVLENDTDYTDALGLPPHSIEAIVSGGTDLDVANAIYATRPDGIETYGSTSQVVTDVNGNPKTIKFSRPVTKTLHVDVTLTEGEGFPTTGDPAATIRAAIVAYALAYLGGGDDVSPFQLGNPINDAVPGIATAVILVDDVDPPVAVGVYEIAPREVSSILLANIDVTIT